MSHLQTAWVCMLQMGLGKTVQAASFLGACGLMLPCAHIFNEPRRHFRATAVTVPATAPHRQQVPDAAVTPSCHDTPALQGIFDNTERWPHALAS